MTSTRPGGSRRAQSSFTLNVTKPSATLRAVWLIRPCFMIDDFEDPNEARTRGLVAQRQDQQDQLEVRFSALLTGFPTGNPSSWPLGQGALLAR